MPASSILPLLNAAALAGTIVSITFNVVLCVLFGIAFLWTTAIWIRGHAPRHRRTPAGSLAPLVA